MTPCDFLRNFLADLYLTRKRDSLLKLIYDFIDLVKFYVVNVIFSFDGLNSIKKF